MKWPKVKLQRVTSKVGSGATPRGGEAVYQPSGTPLIRSMNVHFDGFHRDGLVYINDAEAALLDHVVVQPDDVLFNITGASIGRVTTAPNELAGARVNQHVCILRTTDALVPRFLAYYLSTPEQQGVINSNQVGGTRQAVTKAMLLNWDVPLPAPREQSRIVELLEQADALRQKRAEADALADRILPALFHQLFGDPATNPKGWPEVNGSQIFSEIRYGVGTPPPFANTGIPFLRAGNIDHGTFVPKNLVFFAPEFESSIGRSHVSTGDVVIVRRGAYTGDCAVIPAEFDGAYVGYDLICVPSTTTNPDWFCSAFLYPSIWQRVDAIRSRAAQQGLNKEQILSFSLPYPPKQLQDRFSHLARAIRAQRSQASDSKTKLDLLFATMLHRAFTGELTAQWREAHLKELLAELEQQAKELNLKGEKP